MAETSSSTPRQRRTRSEIARPPTARRRPRTCSRRASSSGSMAAFRTRCTGRAPTPALPRQISGGSSPPSTVSGEGPPGPSRRRSPAASRRSRPTPDRSRRPPPPRRRLPAPSSDRSPAASSRMVRASTRPSGGRDRVGRRPAPAPAPRRQLTSCLTQVSSSRRSYSDTEWHFSKRRPSTSPRRRRARPRRRPGAASGRRARRTRTRCAARAPRSAVRLPAAAPDAGLGRWRPCRPAASPADSTVTSKRSRSAGVAVRRPRRGEAAASAAQDRHLDSASGSASGPARSPADLARVAASSPLARAAQSGAPVRSANPAASERWRSARPRSPSATASEPRYRATGPHTPNAGNAICASHGASSSYSVSAGVQAPSSEATCA